jgi:class 3 adenylate cyclase
VVVDEPVRGRLPDPGFWSLPGIEQARARLHSPRRAVQAARSIRDAVGRIGFEVRAGLHTGECEVSGADLTGIAVHIASRAQAFAGPGEVVVTSTVRDLVTASGLRFDNRGRQQLKGIDGDWELFALAE